MICVVSRVWGRSQRELFCRGTFLPSLDLTDFPSQCRCPHGPSAYVSSTSGVCLQPSTSPRHGWIELSPVMHEEIYVWEESRMRLGGGLDGLLCSTSRYLRCQCSYPGTFKDHFQMPNVVILCLTKEHMTVPTPASSYTGVVEERAMGKGPYLPKSAAQDR